ncbi:MAG: asparaginase [Anaerolineales bacterium]|nr:asparaginase [Anaerolineales bacterium]
MPTSPEYAPLYEFTRGHTVESIHFGAVAIVDRDGTLLAWHGDPHVTTYLRSTAKPFQALPFIEAGGPQAFHLTAQEIALICASHGGTDEHVAVAQAIQLKAGVTENDLLCGTHPAGHTPTREAMEARGEAPTPNRHNCSGKHSGMLASARYHHWAIEDYVNPAHPLQQSIRTIFAEMCHLPPDAVHVGIDGCSAPNFAVPLYNAALAYARLCDPTGLPAARANACHTITHAMTTHPVMIAGPGEFDTRLMEATGGRIVSKGGAEGYQGLGLMPGVLSPDAPGVGITLKISDGAARGGVRAAVVMEVLRQLNVLSPQEWETLSAFGPGLPVYNYRKLLAGEGRPCFTIQTPSNGTP